ncbi:CaiB/BaiF CoA transferase family protein [Falsibacillus albus]|uniref:CoA transferase n=1 Tax=Falsibacillus albus TaxID=2478915 RepID=A0A3L7JTR5_9BACI|nr:CaiB/BaiF CoA-transferase family protein [Falsibacillus albus]RLQ93654.1 CoA transferase [Falsibacillus albus]
MLEGIKVVDFTTYIPGPFATLRLAELGAKVIKVEAPDGDPARHNGNGSVYKAHNRGKKSITLNLKHEEGKRIAIGLLKQADAVIESFRPGVMEKLGLGYKEVSEINPKVVYCSITGYGKEGKMAALGSHDLNYMSLSGALAQLKDASGRPVHPRHTFADYIGGMAASERVLAGLVARGVSGKGSYHCLSLVDALASMMTNHVLIEKETGYSNGVEVLNGTVISYHLYETKDGRYISLGALEPKFWHSFCQALGREDWLSAHYSKPDPSNSVFIELTDLFKSKALSEWAAFGEKVDCCLAPVLEARELAEYPYFQEKDFVSREGFVKMHADLDHGEMSSPPERGEQTEAILKEWLGADDGQILAWKEQRVI